MCRFGRSDGRFSQGDFMTRISKQTHSNRNEVSKKERKKEEKKDVRQMKNKYYDINE